MRKSDGVEVPTRLVGEQHVLEDLGFIPTVQDWLKGLPMRAWMIRGAKVLDAETGAPKGKKSTAARADRATRKPAPKRGSGGAENKRAGARRSGARRG